MSGSNTSDLCRAGMSKLVRPKFAPGMLLQHEDLDQLAAYTRDLNSLMFRSLFGCGVICGLVVKPDPKCGQDAITIGAGLGIDCAGDPIHVPKDQRIVLDENCVPNPNRELWVVLCAKMKCCAPRTAMCPPDEDEPESTCTRERYAFEICVVTERPKCACSCVREDDGTQESGNGDGKDNRDAESMCWCVDPKSPCYKDHYQGKCACDCDDCSGVGCCDCIVLARLTKEESEKQVSWIADHSVRRFIRPVLMRDPQVAEEKRAKEEAAKRTSALMKPGVPVEVAAAKTTAVSKKTKTPTE